MHLKAPSADEASDWVQAIAPLLLQVAPGEGPAQSRPIIIQSVNGQTLLLTRPELQGCKKAVT
jgi:hypothetical protein